MRKASILERRLRNHGLSKPRYETCAEVVCSFGAVQAQEFDSAKWALGVRTKSTISEDIDRAFDAGLILRTHALRSTWHFVSQADIHWMRELMAPRVRQAIAGHDRRFGITDSICGRAYKGFERAFQSDPFVTRGKLGKALKQAGLDTNGTRLALLTVHAEIEGILCSGPRQNDELTYALLSDRAPHKRPLSADDALAELTRRYLQSHAPATLRDYVWWSGLKVADAKRGLEMIGARCETANDSTYWTAGEEDADWDDSSRVLLLPVFDEFLMAYRDRDATTKMGKGRGPVVEQNPVIAAGKVLGHWKLCRKAEDLEIEVTLRRKLTSTERDGLAMASGDYARFLGIPASTKPSIRIA